ncbi:hypothetical protein [Kitasatospora sp. NPDC059327]
MSNFPGTTVGSDPLRPPVRRAGLTVTVRASGDDDGFGWQFAPRS